MSAPATRSSPTRLLGLTRDLPRRACAIAYARQELRRLEAELDAGQLADLQLVVTELVTNALLHGRGAIRLTLHMRFGEIRGEVLDEGEGFTYDASEPDADAVSGRGLRIVDALTSEWCVDPDRSRVRFAMPSPPS